jgi:hypothetical protein
VALAVLTVPAVAQASSGTRILFTSDVGCDVKIDGALVGRVEADEEKTFPTTPGKHFVKAACDGGKRFEEVSDVQPDSQQVVMIRLKQAAAQEATAALQGEPWTKR